MNGKGDKWRKGTNFQQYYNNFDEIFKKDKQNNSAAESSTTQGLSADGAAESGTFLSGENTLRD